MSNFGVHYIAKKNLLEMALFLKIPTLALLLVALAVETCEEDKENKVSKENQRKTELLEIRNATAAADWQKFVKTAQDQVSIAESQLNTIKIRSATMKGGKKIWLTNEYKRNRQLLNNLKEALDKQNSQQPAEDAYDTDVIVKNNSFKSFFLQEIVTLNRVLEDMGGG
jgi:CRISPR/Cas system CMR subunit Cmr4 (Cas7 group RAMP superfamily)